MTTLFGKRIKNICSYLILFGVYVSCHPLNLPQDKAKFSIESILDATIPILHPLVAAGSNRCEALKSIFGLTYEQMQGRNATDFQDLLHIDHILHNGSVKYNLTSIKRLTNLMLTNRTIVILIHGFMESSDGLMVSALAPEFLKMSSMYQIMAFDGRNLINLEYFRSSTYARFMGEKLGSVLAAVIKNGVDPEHLKLIGHSLGAHIAGIAGKQVLRMTGQRLARITALDPAGPCFTGVGHAGRLHRGDAEHVDVIHTNGGMLGLKEPVGDSDFFPNGGWTQPGCMLSTCDHSRAWELYAESITNPHRFPARKCENWTLFTEGRCSRNKVAYMGPEIEPGTSGSYFFATGSRSPYGLGASGSG